MTERRKLRLLYRNIGTQSVQELFFGDWSIRRTVYGNDLVKFFGLRCTARRKLEIYNLLIQHYIGNGKIAK